MYDWHKWKLIDKLQGKSKAIIGIGDSFTQGQGSCSIDLWKKHNWDLGSVTFKDERELLSSFYENSWVNKLCVNHFTDYVPINLGMVGRGNRGAVKELYLHPELNMESIDEKIVVFMLTGIERFDFVHKNLHEHIHFLTIWPDPTSEGDHAKLWAEYYESIWSDKFGIIETLLSIAEAKTWCKAHNAKLYLTSAFRPEYERQPFIRGIMGDIDDETNYLYKQTEYIKSLVDIIDWKKFIRPNGFKCISDYLCSLENREDLIEEVGSGKYYEFAGKLKKLSPKGYVTNCAHPSQKGHEAIAKSIYESITKDLNDELITEKKINLI